MNNRSYSQVAWAAHLGSPFTRLLMLGLLLGLTSLPALASQPVVTKIEPTGVVRGESTTITLQGARLQDARQILMEQPGIEISEVKPVNNESVQVTLTAAADLPPGLYPFRLVTGTGISNMRLLSVGAMKVVAEVEPNSEFAMPQKVDMNVTVTGVVTREDEDYFAVDLKAGQTINCEVEGVRIAYFPQNNSNFFDPFLAILDSNRFEQVTSDDAPLLRQDALCAFTATEDGTYIVQLRESSFGGDDNAHYRLHIGEYPRPVAMVPAGGRPGETIDAKFVGADGSTWNAPLQLPATESTAFPINFANALGLSPSPNMIRVMPMANVVEQEPNDDINAPNLSAEPLPVAFCGVIETTGDHDSFAFEAKKGQKIVTRMFARSLLRTPLDGVTDIFDTNKNRIAGNDDSGGPDSVAEFSAGEDGVYIIRVRDHLLNGGPAYAYRIEVKVAEPELVLSLPEEQQDQAIELSVPRGGHVAVMVNAERREFGGDLQLALEGLPAGITATTFPIAADRTTIPLLLSADANAELAGARVDLQGRPANAQPDIVGHLAQRHKFVLGQNRVDVLGHDSAAVGVAVTEASPVRMELVQPTVPLIRNGSAELKVIAHRNDGYKNPVPVRLLYVPPGVSTNNSKSVEQEQNEMTIPITANRNAVLGKWPMIITAMVDTGNGAIRLGSLPVELTIEDVYFNVTFTKASVEQGGSGQFIVGLEIVRPFEGTADLTLVGIPAGVTSTAPTQPITAETTQVVFPISVAADARAGNHKTLVVQAMVHTPNGDIMQTEGTGEIQIDVPLPAPVAATPAPAAAPAAPAPVAAAPPKPLSRIEQLRLDRMKVKE